MPEAGTTADLDKKQQASDLKAEGNALFAQKEFKQAIEKYTAAISLDTSNAILWTNRAACKLNLKRAADALDDARKATELDTGYAKGWARYAEALTQTGRWDEAVAAWKGAIKALPSTDFTEAESKQKLLFQMSLDEVSKRIEEMNRSRETGEDSNGRWMYKSMDAQSSPDKLPPVRAALLIPELERTGKDGEGSSAWVISRAHFEFESAMDLLKHIRLEGPKGQEMLLGKAGALLLFVNSIMRDIRVFVPTVPDLVDRLLKQVQVEAAQCGAWHDVGPGVVLKEAQARERTQGWPMVRTAINVTARGWVAEAFLLAMVAKDAAGAVAQYDSTLQLLEKGAKIWQNHESSVFSIEFRRGVKVLWMNAYMMAYCIHRNPGAQTRFPLSRLVEMANELVEDCENLPRPLPAALGSPDNAWYLSFYVYPKAYAHSVQAFCWKEVGWREEKKGTPQSRRAVTEAFTNAAQAYERAGMAYPADDEHRPYYLIFAMDSYWKLRTPMKTWWRLMPDIRSSIPQMKRIWEHSQLSYTGRDTSFQKVLEYATEVEKKLKKRRIKLDDPIYPAFSLDM